MTLLVDDARWWWRDQRWAHLASDTSLEELHAFAARLELRRLSFGGDHYDITEAQRQAAVAAGARAVSSRELLRRLQRSGLRRHHRGSHRWGVLAEFSVDPAADPGLAALTPVLEQLGSPDAGAAQQQLAALLAAWATGSFQVRVLRRSDQLAVVCADPVQRDRAQLDALALPAARPPLLGWWISTAPPAQLEIFLPAAAPRRPESGGR